jgi:hypothetical protein
VKDISVRVTPVSAAVFEKSLFSCPGVLDEFRDFFWTNALDFFLFG